MSNETGRVDAFLDEIKLQLPKVIGGELPVADFQRLIDEAKEAGVPIEAIRGLLEGKVAILKSSDKEVLSEDEIKAYLDEAVLQGEKVVRGELPFDSYQQYLLGLVAAGVPKRRIADSLPDGITVANSHEKISTPGTNYFDKLKAKLVEGGGYESDWLIISSDLVATEPNDPEVIDLVRKNLPLPENQLVFRMMSREEFDRCITNGRIGGEVITGQVDSGTTWWGDQLKDSLNQRRGNIKINTVGGVWGGDNGILVAVRREPVLGKTIEKRRSPTGVQQYDAYKTAEAIDSHEIVGAFRVSRGRYGDDDEGFVRVEKMVL